MRNGLGALALAALTGPVGPSSAADPVWKSYASKEGRFTAQFPGEVKVEKKPSATHTSASPPGVDADFRIAFTDREQADANMEAAFKELERIRLATCKAQEIEAEDMLDYLHDRMPACRFCYTKQIGDVKARYAMLFVIDGKRFYQVLYGYSLSAPLKQEGEFFMKSFKVNR